MPNPATAKPHRVRKVPALFIECNRPQWSSSRAISRGLAPPVDSPAHRRIKDKTQLLLDSSKSMPWSSPRSSRPRGAALLADIAIEVAALLAEARLEP